MSLESATYVSQLSPSAPNAGDLRSQGDDHLRLIKQVLQNTFPNASNPMYITKALALQTSNFTVTAPDNGSALIPMNTASAALTVTLPTTGLFDGFEILVFKADYGPNTVTIDGNGKTVNGLSTISLIKGYQWARVVYNEETASWFAVKQEVVPTGAFIDGPFSSVDGYVMADGTSTIGNASSGATVANVRTSALFQLLWNQFADTVCAVSSGRGVSAAADYAANKKITMPDLRGRARFGKDNMGGSAANRITSAGSSIAGNTLGASGGAEMVTLAQANLPNVTLSVSGTISGTTSSDGAHTHDIDVNDASAAGGSGSGPIHKVGTGNTLTTLSSGAHTHTVSGTCTGTSASINGNTAQTAVNKMPPAFITNVFMAL
jgi:hypothetical protein